MQSGQGVARVRERLAAAWVLAAMTAVLFIASSVAPVDASASVAAGAPLSTVPIGATVSGSAITELQMFTPSAGVAMAHLPATAFGGGTYYVVHTIDGGDTWRVSGLLPAPVTPSQPPLLAMAFASPTEGYVSLVGSTQTRFTRDGGTTWSVVTARGKPNSLSIDAGVLWMTLTDCPAISAVRCRNNLAIFKVGRLKPNTDKVIPDLGQGSSSAAQPAIVQATLWSHVGAHGLDSEGPDGARSSILATANSGRSWSTVRDPCGAIPLGGLVARSSSAWFLYCSLDGGMHQGTNELWSTTDAGRDWHLGSEGSEENRPPNVGNIGAEMLEDLTASPKGQTLWLLGSVAGIDVSTDGGTHWVVEELNTGGYPAQIATVGATDAWVAVPGTALYRTTDGKTWTGVGSPGSSEPACGNGQISVSVRDGGAGLGHQSVVLLFTNRSDATCSLTGYPGVAALNSQGSQADQAQREPNGYLGGLENSTTLPLVVLTSGQTASALVEATDVGVSGQACPSYPALIVTPPGFTVSTKVSVGGFPGCSNLEVHPVVPGTSGQKS